MKTSVKALIDLKIVKVQEAIDRYDTNQAYRLAKELTDSILEALVDELYEGIDMPFEKE